MTLVLSTQKWYRYSCHKVRTEGYVTNVTNTDIELVYILFNNETTLTKDLLRYGRNTRPNLILGSFHLGAKGGTQITPQGWIFWTMTFYNF